MSRHKPYHDDLERRILSFPAVFPCEAVSLSTLLSSLISLAHSISNFHSCFFPTQRRNATHTIRLIRIILIFLHELRDHQFHISQHQQSLLRLCFSDLHFTFQNLLFLLHDSTRPGASLWMLIKHPHVSSHFRLFIRAVATALDVLPLHRIHHVSDELKELLQFVANQARRLSFQPDPDDESTAKKVHLVLTQFARGIQPDSASIKQILDYLKIQTWNDCNQELKFLEDEIDYEWCECEEREVPLMSGLIGFLSYCRAVIFDTLDFNNNTHTQERRCSTSTETETILNYCVNPEDFRCPISLELMTDPVTISTGQTYDRASIQKWLNSGKTVCPKTGEKLTNTDLVPNTTLKKLIQHLCAHNGVSITKSKDTAARTAVPGSPASAHAVQFLAWFLAGRLVFGTKEQKNKAAYEIRLLTKSNIFNRSCLIQVGAVHPLLHLLEDSDKSTQENAIAALMKLSKHTEGKEAIMENNGLTPIVKVLKSGKTLESRQIAAATVFYLASLKKYRKTIGENPDAIPSLVQLIKEGTSCGKKNAVVAIYGLLLHPKNHQKVLEANAVSVIINNILGFENNITDSTITTECLGVLAALAENSNEGAEAIVRASSSSSSSSSSSVLRLIIGNLRCTTEAAAREHCISILVSVCVNGGEEVVSAVAKEASVMPALFEILACGKCRAAKKARFLLRILQEFHDKPASNNC